MHRAGLLTQPNLRRSAYGLINIGTQANNTTAALTNNSNSAELLLVWNFNASGGSTSNLIFSQQQRGAFGTLFTTNPIVPTEPVPPGILSGGNSLTTFTGSWEVLIAYTSWWTGPFPFTVLPAGWSLCAQTLGAPTVAILISIWWEAITPERFERFYGFALDKPGEAV